MIITNPVGLMKPFKQEVTACKTLCSVKTLDIIGTSATAFSSPVIRQEFLYAMTVKIEMNCSTNKQLIYKWELFTVSSLIIQTAVVLEGIDTSARDLLLWPFSLKGGLYKVISTVTSIPCGVLKVSHGFFRVRVVELVASIDCGHFRSVSWDSQVILNASRSYDPSHTLYGTEKQDTLKFEWICKDSRGVDCLEKNADRNNSVLTLPPRFLDASANSTYTFVLNVTKGLRFAEVRQTIKVKKQNHTSNLCIR